MEDEAADGESSARPARSTSAAATDGLDAHERQLRQWQTLVTARYLALLLIGLAAALLPYESDTSHAAIAAGLLLVGIPYNALVDLVLRRTGTFHPAVAFADQVLAVGLLAVLPDMLAPALLFMTAITATNAVALGRSISLQSAFVGLVGAGSVAVLAEVPEPVPALITFGVLNGFTAWTVGGMSDQERDLRWRYDQLMDGIDAIVWEQLTRAPSTLYVNDEAVKLLGYPAERWREPGMWSRTVHPDDRVEVRRRYREAIRRGEGRELEYRMIAADGRVVHVLDRMRVETDGDGLPVRVRGVMLDVTARRLAQQKADQFVDLVDGIKLALFVFGRTEEGDGLRLLAVNPEGAWLAGVDAERAVGGDVPEALQLPEHDLSVESLAEVVRTGHGFTVDEVRPARGGRVGRVYNAHAFPLPNDAVGLALHDVTERTMAAEVLRRQALHDGLTGLANRTLLHERAREAIQGAEGDGRVVALLLLDLDQFKEVNDALGHDHGDRLLIEMSRRLQRVLRDADTIARLGGDEFGVLITADGAPDSPMETAIAIRHALEQPFQIGGISVQTSASIGIAVYPDHGTDPETLAQKADIAMYAAKRGGGGAAVYSPELDQSSVRRLSLLGELRGAINEDQLLLHFQPCLDLSTGAVGSCEALVRWQHPEHGLMPPGEFIELAEISGLIGPMTRWILDRALAQSRQWLDDGLELRVGVNLSVRNLYDRDLVPWLADRLVDHGVPAGLLKLEITESELMDDPLLAMEVLGKLKSLGAQTSIDDFGTGYSSLAYLKHLPIDELKIDRSFVGNMTTDASDLTIVRSTVDLAHNLGLSVVAEGVEDADTLVHLAALGCDRAQGYYLSKPVDADTLTAWVAGSSALDDARVALANSSAQSMQ